MRAPLLNDAVNLKSAEDQPSQGLNDFRAELFNPGNSQLLSLRKDSGLQALALPQVGLVDNNASSLAENVEQKPQPGAAEADTVPEGDLNKAVSAIVTDAQDGKIDDLDQLRLVLNTYGPEGTEKFVDDLNTQLSQSGVTAEYGQDRCGGCGGEIALMMNGEYTDRVNFEFEMFGDVIHPEQIERNFG